MELRRALLATALLVPIAAHAQQTQSTVSANVPAVGAIVEQSGPQFRANFQAAINDINVLFARGGGGGGAVALSFGNMSGFSFGIYYGSGAPTISAPQGSMYLRTDGAANTRVYINSNGSTTWVGMTSS